MSAKFIEFFKLNMSSSIYRPRSREKLYNLQLKHFFPKQQTHRHQLPPSLSTAISCRTETLIQQDWYKQKANPGFLENFIKVTDLYGTEFHLQHRINYSPCISDRAQRQLPLKTFTQSPANLMIWKLEMENRRFFFKGDICICMLREDVSDLKHSPRLIGVLLLSLLYLAASISHSISAQDFHVTW